MIVQDNFLKKLRSVFDLNIYEVKIWTALLSKGMATAGELSDISNVPRSRSYDVLESLEKKGFVMMKIGKPIKYLAVSPEEIIRRVKKAISHRSDEKIKGLDEVKGEGLFKDLELLYKEGIEHVDPSNLSGAIKGRDSIYNHIEAMIDKAESSIIIATSATEFPASIRVVKDRLKKLGNKKIKIRIATQPNEEIKNLPKEVKNFVEVKAINDFKSRFVIVDGKDVMFMMANDKEVHEDYDTGIWVNTGYFAKALESLFNLSWSKAS